MLFNVENNCRKLSELSDFFVLRLFCWPFCPFCFPKTSRKFFPIIGKPPKNFSNHWKNRTEFSNHWKKIFQSLENSPFPDGPADWPKPGPVQGAGGAVRMTGGTGAPPVLKPSLHNGAARCRTPGSGAEHSGQPSRDFRRCGFQPRPDGWKAGGMPTLKTMKTASRTLKRGREADGLPERGRPAREAAGKRITSEKANVFRNLTRPLPPLGVVPARRKKTLSPSRGAPLHFPP